MRERQQKEFNSFPMFFAYDDKQFDEGMRKLGLQPEDTKKIYHGIEGMYYRRVDAPKLHEMFERFDRELRTAIAADTTGDGFVYDMFRQELEDHEYQYTQDITEALEATGLEDEDFARYPLLQKGLEKAIASMQKSKSIVETFTDC